MRLTRPAPVTPITNLPASDVDVEGTYTNIPGTPTDLETALASIDTVLGTPFAFPDFVVTDTLDLIFSDNLELIEL